MEKGLSGLLVLFCSAALTAQSTTWTGNSDGNWSNAGNWSAGVPNAATTAIIGTGPNAPTVNVAGAACSSLTVQAGASLQLANALAVAGSVSAAGPVSGASALNLTGSGTITGSGAGTLGIVNVVAGAGAYTVVSGTFAGDFTQAAGAAAVSIQAATMLLNCTFLGGGVAGLPASALTVGGILTMNPSVPVSTPPSTINVQGTWNSNANWAPTSGLVVFGNPVTPTVANYAVGTIWNDVTVGGFLGVYMQGNVNVAGVLRMTQGPVHVAGTTVNVGDTWSIAQGSQLDAPNVTSVTLGSGGLLIAGVLNAPLATLTANGNVNGFVTGGLALGTGPHTFTGNLAFQGFIVAPGSTFVFTGAGNISVNAANNTLPAVQITGANYTIQLGRFGSLQHTGAGNLNIQNCTVLGSCTLAGASVADYAHGTLNCLGGVTWNTAVTTPPATINCAGPWVSNASFAPTSGLVVFAGGPTQSVAVPSFQWSSLRIAAGTAVTTSLPIGVTGFLDVQGTLTSSGGSVNVGGALTVGGSGSLQATSATTLSVNGGLTVSAGGSLGASSAVLALIGDAVISGNCAIGAGNHTLANSLTVNAPGQLTAAGTQPLTFTGSGSVNVPVGSPLPAATFVGGQYDITSLALQRDLTQSAGTLRIHTCTVGRNAVLLGTAVLDLNVGTFSIVGNVNWTTATTVTTPPATINCGGNWTSTTSFAPQSGLVVLNGVGAQTVTMPVFQWFNLRIGSTSSVTTAQSASALGYLDVQGNLTCNGASVVTQGALTIGSTGVLNAPAATSIQFVGGATISGTLGAGNAVLTSVSDLTIAVGGACALGNGTHVLSAGLSQYGALTLPATASVQFAGLGNIDANAAWPLPNVSFTNGPYTVINLTASGPLTQTAGRLVVVYLRANGSATFQGQTVDDGGLGQLTVVGNLTFATTNAVAHPPATITCGGAFNANSQFLPSNGVVVMNGATPQTMTAPLLSLNGLTVALGSQVTFSTIDVIVGADLTVNGQVTAPSGTLEVRGNLVVGSSGNLMLSTGSCTVAASCTNSGAISGTTALTMKGNGNLSGNGAFPGVSILSVGEVTTSGTLAIGGDLSLGTGSLRMLSGSTAQVAGSLKGTGGVLGGTATSQLNVLGSVTLNGVLAAAAGVPNIQCAGGWRAQSSYQPGSGTVTFTGPGSLTASDGTLTFFNVQINNGARSLATSQTIIAQSIHVSTLCELRLDGNRLSLTAPSLAVDGTLSFTAGGQLFLGQSSAVTIASGGTLRMIGTWAAPVVIDGPGTGSAYAFTIQGNVEAVNYEFHHMNATGVDLRSTAVIAPAPHDLRGGLFADGAAGGTLLTLDRPVSTTTELRYLRFANTPVSVTYNISTPPSAAFTVNMVNYSGDFVGDPSGTPNHTNAPVGVINWLPQQRTVLTADGFVARAAVHRAELRFTTTAEVDTVAFHLVRGNAVAGPFTELPSSPLPHVGPSTYARTDTAVTDTTRYFYQLQEELTHGEIRVLGNDFARPWPQSIGNVLFVGTGGGYPDLATAVAASVPGQSIVVQAGTYQPCVINKAVRIVPDGSGPVIIDTSASQFSIQNIPAGSFDTVLRDLQIGGPGNLFGMDVTNCGNIVLLDGLTVTAAGVALELDNATQVAVENCTLTGTPGLLTQNGTQVYLSRGTCNAAIVSTNAQVDYCNVQPPSFAPVVNPTGTAVAHANPMPSFTTASCWATNKRQQFDIDVPPGDFWGVVFSLRRDYLNLSLIYPIDMVLLLDQTLSGTLATGVSTGPLPLNISGSSSTGIWGANIPMQILTLNGTTGRMGISHEIILVP